MLRFLLVRACYGLAVLLGVSTVAFGLIHLSGDPIAALTPPSATAEDRQILRERYGLDDPLPLQYVAFLGRAVQGDFGDSWRQNRPAMSAVVERLPRTLLLTGTAIGLAIVVGGTLGLVAGTRPGGPADLLATSVALLGQTIPGFWLGTVLILIFSVNVRWFPASGFDGPRSLILPALTLATYPTAMIARLLRGSLIETLRHDYIRTARGKGLPERRVLIRHALGNAAPPTLAYLGLQIGILLGGAVIVEAVFAYPGLGSLTLAAATDRDLPIIQAAVVVIATVIVVINFLVDALAHLIDPRLHQRAAVSGRSRAWTPRLGGAGGA